MACAFFGLVSDAVMLSAPVVGSTVPVTCEATAATSGLPSSLAAWSWTAVLPRACTGSGRVTGLDDWPVALVVELIWIRAVDS
jgi:hypothetical protein